MPRIVQLRNAQLHAARHATIFLLMWHSDWSYFEAQRRNSEMEESMESESKSMETARATVFVLDKSTPLLTPLPMQSQNPMFGEYQYYLCAIRRTN